MQKKIMEASNLHSSHNKKRDYIGKLVQRPRTLSPLGRWFVLLLVLGVTMSIGVTVLVNLWFRSLELSLPQVRSSAVVETLSVQRSAPYAGLNIAVLNAQYASSFDDDKVRPGPAVIRLNIQVKNPTKETINLVYYDIARLLIPGASPIAPTTVQLPVGTAPGASQTGWIDFPVPQNVKLATLMFQLGSLVQNESLVKVPFSGNYDAKNYENSTTPLSMDLTYNFNGTVLVYHLKSVERRYSYKGGQAKAEQQFYVFNFQVDNLNERNVTTGLAFDYLRLNVNDYNRAPLESNLPETFKGGTKNLSAYVVFSGPAHMSTWDVVFLPQFGGENQHYTVNV